MSRRTALVTVGLGIVVLSGIVAVLALGNYRINLTPSSAYGLWKIAPLEREIRVGDRIFVCPPVGEIAQLGLKRGYLSPGLCPSGTGPLIKTIAALSGQTVQIDGQVVIDGEPLAHSVVLKADAHGRPMPVYHGGTVGADTLFLHSNFVGSYDSRYFGPVPVQGLLGHARKVLTFSP